MEMIAHRGASAVAPESTPVAIRMAVASKADMIELDVQMTKDQRLVIFHDDRLERTSDGSGRLSGKTYRQLQKLDTGSWFEKRYQGQRILLASQVFPLLPKRVGVNFELKRTSQHPMLIRQFLRLITQAQPKQRIVISSFDSALVEPFAKNHACALICSRRPAQSLKQAVKLGCRGWHLRDNLVTAKLIEAAHAAGLKVRVWTVDEPRRAIQLMKWGVDGIFTNNPGRLSRFIQ